MQVTIDIDRDKLPEHADAEFEAWLKCEIGDLGDLGGLTLKNPLAMQDLELIIERIENGFIVTEDGKRTYYNSLRKLVDCKIGEEMDCADRYFKEHAATGEVRKLTFSVISA